MKRRDFLINTLKGSVIASLPISLSSFNLTNNKVEIGDPFFLVFLIFVEKN